MDFFWVALDTSPDSVGRVASERKVTSDPNQHTVPTRGWVELRQKSLLAAAHEQLDVGRCVSKKLKERYNTKHPEKVSAVETEGYAFLYRKVRGKESHHLKHPWSSAWKAAKRAM